MIPYWPAGPNSNTVAGYLNNFSGVGFYESSTRSGLELATLKLFLDILRRAAWMGVLTFFLALMVSTRAQAIASLSNESRDAAALFSQYETVFYTNTDLSSKFSSFKGLSRQTAGALSVPFGDLIYGLDLLDPYASADILAKSEAVLMGGKGFNPPEGEGAAQVSRFCYIVDFGTRRLFRCAGSRAAAPASRWDTPAATRSPCRAPRSQQPRAEIQSRPGSVRSALRFARRKSPS